VFQEVMPFPPLHVAVYDESGHHAMKADILKRIRVARGKKVRLEDFDTSWTISQDLVHEPEKVVKRRASALLERNRAELAKAQELLWANDSYALLIVLQAMDAAGKDGTIKHVMSGVNPQGCQVFSFKQPSAEELDHNFLWRYSKAVPERGRIGIFNRSHYEEVLVVRVHPEWLDKQSLPPGKRGKKFWKQRYEDINGFERHLTANGVLILKFFLHISKDMQKKRFLERLETPDKYWKFSVADLAERGHWDEYVAAYEAALSATSTEWAPWHIIPADHKWSARVLVAEVITSTIQSLNLKYPKPTREALDRLEVAKQALLKE
jgi:PPK2 family polyphosphate:nucleotide phosphotransferase